MDNVTPLFPPRAPQPIRERRHRSTSVTWPNRIVSVHADRLTEVDGTVGQPLAGVFLRLGCAVAIYDREMASAISRSIHRSN